MGGKVPASQKPKHDEGRLAECNFLNDINNGLNVTDEEIAKLFPAEYSIRVIGDPNPPALHRRAGLNEEYQKKLDIIRTKKKDDVKAAPPEKK